MQALNNLKICSLSRLIFRQSCGLWIVSILLLNPQVGQSYTPSPTATHLMCEGCRDTFTDFISRTNEVVQGAATAPSTPVQCPDNVQHIRKLMALSYGSCKAFDEVDWFNVIYSSDSNNGIFLKGYRTAPSRPPCEYQTNDGKACTFVDNYNDVMSSHPYNKLPQESVCQQHTQCNFGGEQKRCPTLFALASEGYAYHDQTDGKIDIFKYKTGGHNNQMFLGWNCSEYVTTAMALAGHRMIQRSDDNAKCGDVLSEDLGQGTTEDELKQSYPSSFYNNLADNHASCSCLRTVDITQENNKIESGDIITLNSGNSNAPGHVMIVEATGDPFFRNPNPNNVDGCKEENISFAQLQIRTNHSSGTGGGPGSMKFNEHQYIQYAQSLTRAVSQYQHNNKTCMNNPANSGFNHTPCAEGENCDDCWDDQDQTNFESYLHLAERLDPSIEAESDKWKTCEQTGGDCTPGALWAGRPNPDWLRMRKYLSAVCLRRFFPTTSEARTASEIISAMGKPPPFNVIRHAANDTEASSDKKNNCLTQEDKRPSLANEDCLGGCQTEKENLCTEY